MTRVWPPELARVPNEDWVSSAPESLALTYDTVQDHGWYRNLDPTVAALDRALGEGDLLLDYSGGTGILAERLLERVGGRAIGILIVDSSPKFLRVALEKLGGDERVAFRLIRYLREERRLETVQEVLEPALLARGVDVVASTNAIHLYYDLDDTLRSWRALLPVGGQAFVQSGNIGVPDLPAGAWVIDETVEALGRAAEGIVRTDERYARFRAGLDDPERRRRYAELREKFFLPVRPLAHYLAALERTGFRVAGVEQRPLEASTEEWVEFLSAYHEGVLGWAGGSERVEGVAPDDEAVALRLRLLREAAERVFAGPAFTAVWTYVEAEAAQAA